MSAAVSGPSERDPLLRNASVEHSKAHGIDPTEISQATRFGILAGIWSATFLSSLNSTLAATLLTSISSEFNQANQASWLGTAFLLATCVFTPLYGRLSNVLGRRGAQQTAVAFSAVGTLACGLSKNMEMLIAARFLTGIGGGGTFTLSSIIVSDMYSIRSRGLAQGMQSVFNGLGMGLGGPIGGLMNDWLGWRWAFLVQVPLYATSFVLTSYNLNYQLPGQSKSAKEVLKRIDYGGSLTLLGAIGSGLVFLSTHFNDQQPWSSNAVRVPFALSIVSAITFVIFELKVAREPVLAPFLLRQKIPVLVGLSNFFVAMCNFSINYFFPMWFQTVALTSASTAGLHLMPNSLSMSIGSLFAGWMMHKTGKYKMMNVTLGILPFFATLLITMMNENSGPLQTWISIIPLGLGNAVVLQTVLICLLAHVPRSHMAVATGFGQLFRGVGQVGGVAVSSAIFQTVLDRELKLRITTPDAPKIISEIRHSATLVKSLPPDLQRHARDSYAISLRAVFIMATCSTLIAYIVRLPLPEKELDDDVETTRKKNPPSDVIANRDIAVEEEGRDNVGSIPVPRRPRGLSAYQSIDGSLDLEDSVIGGSARGR